MSRIRKRKFLCAMLAALLCLGLAGRSLAVAQEKKDDKTRAAGTAEAQKAKLKSDSQAANGQETKSELTAAVREQEKDRDKNKEKKLTGSGANEAKPTAGGGTATGTAPPSKGASGPAPTPPTRGMVWVNLDSGIYHKEGSRWYGKTKNGKFMREADAKKAGYRPAKRK